MIRSKINPHIQRWIDMVETGEYNACNDQHLLVTLVRLCFDTEDIYTDDEQLEKYLGLVKYFPYERLFEWEAFCIALHLCTFWRKTGRPRWPDLLLLSGRGTGKDGYIAFQSTCLASPYSNLPMYDIDICANAEEQAMRPVEDVVAVMEDVRFRTKLKKHFYWTKEMVQGLKTRAKIRGRTSNPKSKDGMRSGEVVFNEIHQYENYKNIKAFTTGLGKKKHPRRLFATTNGDVREGPLDDLLAQAEQILNRELPDKGMLPFICRLDDKKEADDKKCWEKANPSLPYLPDLFAEIEKEYDDWKANPLQNPDFMTKRMNLPQSASAIIVTDWENIKATNKEIPDLTGWSCVVGIDYMKVTDFASVDFHFREGDIRYDINHSWLCLKSRDLHRLKIPWQEWADVGYLTLVDDVEIHPDLIAEYILNEGQKYNILKLALDNYRYALLTKSLKNVGFDAKEKKNVKLVRPSDIMKVQPVIDSCFANQYFIWGDNPPLRWATNNTKLVPAGHNIKAASGSTNVDFGNFVYGKIEPKSRKTDPFMAVVAAMCIEDELGDGGGPGYDDLPVIIC
jgi:phage terminase large subunit-like protein